MTTTTPTSKQVAKLTPGTLAFHAVELLKQRGPGAVILNADLASALGQLHSSIGAFLGSAVRDGYLYSERVDGFVQWSLGHLLDPTRSVPTPNEDDDTNRRRVLQVPAVASPSVFAYAALRGAAPFSASLSTDGRLTAERNGRVVCEFTDAERRILLGAAVAVTA
jgi:hypothetical protein